MCAVEGCGKEPVVLVDIDMPFGVARQRLGYCVQHAAELNLDGPLVTGEAVSEGQGNSFPSRHALGKKTEGPIVDWVSNG